MPAIRAIREEHEIIQELLLATETVARRAQTGDVPDEALLAEAQSLIQTLVEGCHHAKEMGVLLPALMDKGAWRRPEILAVMCQEHELGAGYVAVMAEALSAPLDARAWAHAALAYVELVRNHVQMENRVLLPRAEWLLTDEEQAALARGFEQVEEQWLGPGGLSRLQERVRALAEAVSSR